MSKLTEERLKEQIVQIIDAGGKIHISPFNFDREIGIAVETAKEVRNGARCKMTGEGVEQGMQELFDWFVKQ
jgi:hypothetical protein